MQTKTRKNKKLDTQGGFVALFAVLLSMIVLAIAIGISNISYKEMILTSQAREANYAFFAADTGVECALYYDLVESYFSGGTPTINCATIGNFIPDYAMTLNPSGTTGHRYSFDIDLGASCAKVVVLKNVEDTANNIAETIIESKGYNRDCNTVNNSGGSLSTENSRLVERAVRAVYTERTL